MLINSELQKLCKSCNIPIVREETVKLISNLINQHKLETILEIGTAYGYSSHIFAQIDGVKKIVTIEKNIDNYNVAQKFLKEYKNVILINDDAFKYLPDQKYDFIFIDGPKSHQEKLIERYLPFLDNKGIMVIDNLFLNKIRLLDKKTPNQIKLLKKLDFFVDWLQTSLKDLNYNFEVYDIDDGIGIIRKNGKQN